MPWYTSYLIQAYAFVGNTWKDTLWDLAAFITVACTLWTLLRHGGRVAEARSRAVAGLVLLTAASLLDFTDELLGLSNVALIGRMSAWHEGIEKVLYVVGVVLFLSAVRVWIQNHD